MSYLSSPTEQDKIEQLLLLNQDLKAQVQSLQNEAVQKEQDIHALVRFFESQARSHNPLSEQSSIRFNTEAPNLVLQSIQTQKKSRANILSKAVTASQTIKHISTQTILSPLLFNSHLAMPQIEEKMVKSSVELTSRELQTLPIPRKISKEYARLILRYDCLKEENSRLRIEMGVLQGQLNATKQRSFSLRKQFSKEASLKQKALSHLSNKKLGLSLDLKQERRMGAEARQKIMEENANLRRLLVRNKLKLRKFQKEKRQRIEPPREILEIMLSVANRLRCSHSGQEESEEFQKSFVEELMRVFLQKTANYKEEGLRARKVSILKWIEETQRRLNS